MHSHWILLNCILSTVFVFILFFLVFLWKRCTNTDYLRTSSMCSLPIRVFVHHLIFTFLIFSFQFFVVFFIFFALISSGTVFFSSSSSSHVVSKLIECVLWNDFSYLYWRFPMHHWGASVAIVHLNVENYSLVHRHDQVPEKQTAMETFYWAIPLYSVKLQTDDSRYFASLNVLKRLWKINYAN